MSDHIDLKNNWRKIMKNSQIATEVYFQKALLDARSLSLPSHKAMLSRDQSVQQFWDKNKNLLEHAWEAWETIRRQTSPNLLTPDDSLLDARLRNTINQAWEDPSKESLVRDLWEEVIPGVYKAQFFDPVRLAEFRAYLQEAVAANIPTRPPYGIALNRYGAMLDPRSVGYFAAPSFQVFYRQILDTYMRPVARLLLDTYGYDNQTFGFTIQYQPDGDKSLQPHTDASSATMNINLNLPDEKFTGSEVDFFDSKTGKSISTVFEPGAAIIHRGNVPHATHPITSGQRTNMVLWLYGERMQVSRGGNSSYGGTAGEKSSADIIEVNAKERWSASTTPLDGYAPF